ncbi:MAG: hypothetical protein R3F13_05245 [Prosthecobacter sp.]
MNQRAIAIHEASHAVVGICLGRSGLLKYISIVATQDTKGGCHWDVLRGKCPPDEQGQEIGICCAGPVGQVLYAPDSLGEYSSKFQETIFQPDEVLEEAGCAGWASTDLNQFIAMRRKRWPLDMFTEVEAPLKELLRRSSVEGAILELAHCLESLREIDGAAAEQIIKRHLSPHDYVGKAYLA